MPWNHLDIEPGQFFRVDDAYFQAMLYGEPQDFGGMIGERIPARRLRVDLDDTGCDVEPVGDREWVQTARLNSQIWPTERELREHLYETELS